MHVPALTAEELAACRKAFAQFDRDQSGTIDVRELKQVLDSMGQQLTDEALFAIVHEVDEDNSGEIDFAEFCKVITKHKEATAASSDEADTLDAFVALGGNADKSGTIRTDKLRDTIKEFELTLDIDRLIREVDYAGSGVLCFRDFQKILA